MDNTVQLEKKTCKVPKTILKRRNEGKLHPEGDWVSNLFVENGKPLKFFVYGFTGEKRRLVVDNIEQFGGEVVDEIGDTVNILKQRVIPPKGRWVWAYYSFIESSIKGKKLSVHHQHSISPQLINQWKLSKEQEKKEESRNSEDEKIQSFENHQSCEPSVPSPAKRREKCIMYDSSDNESKEENDEKEDTRVTSEDIESECTSPVEHKADESEAINICAEISSDDDKSITSIHSLIEKEKNGIRITDDVIMKKRIVIEPNGVVKPNEDVIRLQVKKHDVSDSETTNSEIVAEEPPEDSDADEDLENSLIEAGSNPGRVSASSKNVFIKTRIFLESNEVGKPNEDLNPLQEKNHHEFPEDGDADEDLEDLLTENTRKSGIVVEQLREDLDTDEDLEDLQTESGRNPGRVSASLKKKKKKKPAKDPDRLWKVHEIKECLELLAEYRRTGLIYEKCYKEISRKMKFGATGEKKRSAKAVKSLWLKVKWADMAKWVDCEIANYLKTC